MRPARSSQSSSAARSGGGSASPKPVSPGDNAVYRIDADGVAREIGRNLPVRVRTTFLGAHVVPREFTDDPAGYVDLVSGPMLEACAPHAKWIDVFCEAGAFDDDLARAILSAGRQAGPRSSGSSTRP